MLVCVKTNFNSVQVFPPASSQLFKVCGLWCYTPVYLDEACPGLKAAVNPKAVCFRPVFSPHSHMSIHASLKRLFYVETFRQEFVQLSERTLNKQKEQNIIYGAETQWSVACCPQKMVLSPQSGLLLRSCKHIERKKRIPLVDENVDSSLLSWIGEEQRRGALQLETDGFLICACLWMSVFEPMWAYKNCTLHRRWNTSANKSVIGSSTTNKLNGERTATTQKMKWSSRTPSLSHSIWLFGRQPTGNVYKSRVL